VLLGGRTARSQRSILNNLFITYLLILSPLGKRGLHQKIYIMADKNDTNNSLVNTQDPISIPLDPRTGGKTVLDSGSDGDVPISWGAMSSTAGILEMSDENDSEVSSLSSPGKPKRTKRSPNRDDSDSDDEDENGNKLEKKLEDSQTSTFNPATDVGFLTSGLKAGFSEDRNKRFRRTMEVIVLRNH
jgi:hypothetical protein